MQIKRIVPEVAFINFWTNLPSLQHRNKHIFNIVLQHESLFGPKAARNYFEVCHDKRPCDRLWGTTKLMAGNVIKQRKYVIQDAFSFFSWAESMQVSSKILYKFISSESVALRAEEIKPMSPSIIHSTMKLHVVVRTYDEEIDDCNMSCCCSNCFSNGKFTYNFEITSVLSP